jgi:hypothetical protein
LNQDACRDTALLLVHLMVAGEASNDGGNGEGVRPRLRIEKKLRQRGRRGRLGFVQSFYTAPGRVPRHGFGRGDGASAREKGFTASCCPPAHGDEEDDALFDFFRRRGTGLCFVGELGHASGLVLGCRGGLWRPGEPGKAPFSLFLFISVFLFLFS